MRARIFVLENQRRIPVKYEFKFHEVLLKCQQIKPKIQTIMFCTTKVYFIYSDLYVQVLFSMKIVFRITHRPCFTVLLVWKKVILFKFGLVIL